VPRDPHNPELPLTVPLERRGGEKPTADLHVDFLRASSPSKSSSHTDGTAAPTASTPGRSLTQSTKLPKDLVLCFKFADHASRSVPSKSDIQGLTNADSDTPPPPSPHRISTSHVLQYVVWCVRDTDRRRQLDHPPPVRRRTAPTERPDCLTSYITTVLQQVDWIGVVNWSDYDAYENGGQGNDQIDSLAWDTPTN